uniref:Uncharacterized protein n=1 Tax=Zea mays TaxID=4577 RepID=B6SU30_MAIZE|nr:hypothetical protein [Zea mays]
MVPSRAAHGGFPRPALSTDGRRPYSILRHCSLPLPWTSSPCPPSPSPRCSLPPCWSAIPSAPPHRPQPRRRRRV